MSDITCPKCKGEGTYGTESCKSCGGSGVTSSGVGCKPCGGTGIVPKTCFMCGGSGSVPNPNSNT